MKAYVTGTVVGIMGTQEDPSVPGGLVINTDGDESVPAQRMVVPIDDVSSILTKPAPNRAARRRPGPKGGTAK